MSRRMQRGRSSRRSSWHRRSRLPWWLHLIGWLALAVPLAVAVIWWATPPGINWWAAPPAALWAAAPVGVIAFEVVLAALVLRRAPVAAGGGGRFGGRGDDGGTAGVREPRRPLPTRGSGAARVPG